MKIDGRARSTNVVDMRNDPIGQLIGTIAHANQSQRARMGEGPYTIPTDANAPLGWDYDTVTTLLDELGWNIDDLDVDRQHELTEALETNRATNNGQGMDVLMQVLAGWDPHNEPVKDKFPIAFEDDPNGYWDAENMGNGQGRSFQVENDRVLEADPVGKMPMESLLHTFLMGLRR